MKEGPVDKSELNFRLEEKSGSGYRLCESTVGTIPVVLNHPSRPSTSYGRVEDRYRLTEDSSINHRPFSGIVYPTTCKGRVGKSFQD